MRSLIRFRARKEDGTVEVTVGLSKGLLIGIMVFSLAMASLGYAVMPAQSEQAKKGGKRAIGSNKFYSESVQAGDYVFLSGKIAVVRGKVLEGGIRAETQEVLENLKKALAKSRLTMNDVVRTTVYLRDLGDYPGMNAVYQKYFTEGPPARTTVVTGIVLNASVEIDVIAYRGNK